MTVCLYIPPPSDIKAAIEGILNKIKNAVAGCLFSKTQCVVAGVANGLVGFSSSGIVDGKFKLDSPRLFLHVVTAR